MDAGEFVRKWAASKRGERAASQEHFIDLCGLLGEATPNSDPTGDYYAFEKGATTKDGEGFADVWQRKHFAWEYKGKRKDLIAAYAQLQRYREALENPPPLVVCDLDRFEVHTNWNDTESWVYEFRSADLVTDDHVDVRTLGGSRAKDPPQLTAMQVVKALFEEPTRLRPVRTRQQITEDAAKMFGEISESLQKWDVPDMDIARFITKTMFCMFATDVGLLPKETFGEVIRVHREKSDAKAFRRHLADLFEKMNTGGEFQMQTIPCFNGQMFRDTNVPEQISGEQIHTLGRLDDLDWAGVEPAVFGTLFEGILERDPKKRKVLGAHYTSRDDIELIVKPVLMEPLEAEWRGIVAEMDAYAQKRVTEAAKTERARKLILPFHRRLCAIRVLDPACGSGNFLYVSLALLKGLEKQVSAYAGSYGVTVRPRVNPLQLHGIEINEYAHELASIVIWIGYLQWKKENQPAAAPDIPILQPLEQIEMKDAILERRKKGPPREATWPATDVIVGNPPFLGGKPLRAGLGDAYVDELFAAYDGRVARESDLCCYWFEKARAAIESGGAKRAGLLATQGIRGGANRKVLERIKETGDIFYAQADRPWVLDGAAVHVSMVGFDDGSQAERRLNEETDGDARHALMRALPVREINANLTTASDATQARRLKENAGICFQGPVVVGPFDIEPPVARRMLAAPNPHGQTNSLVVFPFVNAADLTGRSRGWSIIDFGQRSAEEAALFEAPFEWIKREVKPLRDQNRDAQRKRFWWRHGRAGTELRAALAGKKRQLATPRVSKYRVFVWLDADTVVSDAVVVFARSDDFFFGVLQSRAHEVWARATGTQLREVESGFRYTPTTCFETFPLPRGTQEQHRAISIAAKNLNGLRERWLNPTEMIGAKDLAKRTLTNLYNARPTWLVDAHRTLDEAVFRAYGWAERPGDLRDAEIVARLLALNLTREAV